jgi:hypothetical protein
MLAAALTLLAGMLGAEAAPAALRPAAGKKPHIIIHLADDFGWANAGWHRARSAACTFHLQQPSAGLASALGW